MSERIKTRLLLVIGFVLLSGAALMPSTTFAEDDAGISVEDLEQGAEMGIALMQYYLGIKYYSIGQGIPQDYKEAMKWFRKAAEQGYADAQAVLGLMYVIGQGVPQDYKEAIKWCRKAVEQGNANAQFTLGNMYLNGEAVAQDYKEAVKLFSKAAEQGEVSAQLNLGIMYFSGRGVPQDYVESYAWLNISAAQGSENASKSRDIVAEQLSLEALAKAQELSKEYYKKYVEPFQ